MKKSKYFTSTIHTEIESNVDSGIFGSGNALVQVQSGFGQKIEDKCNELDEKGYEIISILPLISGLTQHFAESGAGASFTKGVVITGKLIES